MTHPDILIDTAAGVTTLTLARVDKKNALTASMYQTLADALNTAAKDTAQRVVVIQGHELIFCAGNDIADFLQNPPKAADAPVFQFLTAISTFPKPLVASVCGPAVGIGTTMLLHCDLVVAGDNAQLAMPFVNLGLCAEGGSSLLAPQRMGYARAAEALLLGEPILAETALELGLVNRVVPPTEANATAAQLAAKLATKPQSSLIETKRLMKAHQAPLLANTMAQEAQTFGRMLTEPAAKEAFGAFMQKRMPDFSKI